MYDELIKRLREDVPTALVNCDFDFVEGWAREAADAIEELAAFKAQITNGRFYVYKFGTLFELRNDPRDLTVKLQYPELPKEET